MNIHSLPSNFFNRDRNLVCLSNSIRKAFGLPTYHPTIPEIDEALQGKKKIALFLFDGLGALVQDALPKQAKVLRSHRLMEIYSTNPATTVAATDAIRSARYPVETGWMGWTQYFEEWKAPVNCFPLRHAITNEPVAPDRNLMTETCHYVSVANELFHAAHKAKESFQHSIQDAVEDPENPPLRSDSLRAMKKNAEAFFRDGGEFLYSYFPDPDHTIHHHGVASLATKRMVRRINRMVKSFAKRNPDVTLLVVADHGLIDVRYVDLATIPELSSCIDHEKGILLESRTPSFFIEKGKEKTFERLFQEHFGKDAVLMTKKEALESGYFGEGAPHPRAASFLGDYVAVMMNDVCLYDSSITPEKRLNKGHHAGGTDMERLVRVSLFNA